MKSGGLLIRSVLRICILAGMTITCAHAEPPPPVQAGEPNDRVSAILLRPLFEPDRRPKGVARSDEGSFDISGIVGKDRNWRAIFKPEKEEAKSRVVTVGEQVDGWTVTAIAPEAVTLSKGSETKRMSPVFSKFFMPEVSEKDKLAGVKIMSQKRKDPHLAW
ncbi:hypothetical protein [Acetobacter fallax]|uniref:Uncharacterized protein n=1 Tax=Acetobacter fallax TaxID=1737473 RepID=A0ABX0KA28_9PROT|nr:hypothetical protein [Acetobacter fallax]NHO32810.1 hypothetical protein [Acetobacter fallax]NHO36406.1 hypothetical protein [Acetobacter fallax]